MYSVCAFLVLTLLSAASAQASDCTCPTMKWASCDGTPCACTLLIAADNPLNINCSKLVPKCFLMKAEMYRASKGMSTRRLGKPNEHAFVDNDGIYDPECDSNGAFRARQCNRTETCWCVNSAGVRRTDKGDLNLKCDKLVQTTWVQAQLTANPVQTSVDPVALKAAMTQTIQSRYFLDPSYVENVQYFKEDNLILVDLKNPKGDPNVDIATVAYYMEKDVKVLPLFMSNSSLTTTVDGTPLGFRNILVYYVDAEPPTFTMKKLTAGVIAVIVVVVLAIIAGLVVLFLTRKKEKSQKAQVREMDDLQKEQLTS